MSAITMERQSVAFLAAARDLGFAVAPAGALRWALSVPARPSGVSARLDADWLLLESSLPAEPGPPAPWELLRWHARLAGPAKFVLAADDRVALRAEIPVDDPSVLPSRLRGWCTDLVAAADLLNRRATEVLPPVFSDAEPAPYNGVSARELLGPECEAAGWSFTERSAGQLCVAFDLPEGYHQACIDVHADGAVRASVELGGFDRVSPLGRRALGILLLNASAMVRLARAAVLTSGDQEATVLFEVRFTAPLGEGELNHALSALATAARLCGREVDALRAEPLAMTYLRVHEPGSGETGFTEVTPHHSQEVLHATE